MKMTRILASLLCIMMVVCALPMMASAAVPVNLAVAVAEVLGYSNAIPAASSNDWPTTNLDLTAEGAADTPCLNIEGVTFDTTDGAVFGETKSKMYYQPRELSVNKVPVWSPFAISGSVTFGFKLSENGSLQVSGEEIWGDTQMRVDLAPGSVGVWESTGERGGGKLQLASNLVNYAPGTEWNDVLVTKDKATANLGGYTVYMKKATDTEFTKVAISNSFCYCTNHGDCDNGGLKFEGANAAVNYAIAYKGTGAPVYSSIDAIVGEATGSTYDFVYDENSNFANSTGRTGFLDGTIFDSTLSEPSAYKFDSDGLTQKDDVDGTHYLTWYAFNSWSPLNSLNSTNPLNPYARQALYMKAKGNFNVRMKGPDNGTRMEMKISVGQDIGKDCCTMTNVASVSIQDEWTEYLIVPDAVESGIPTTAVLYVKAENATGGKWWKTKTIKFGTGSQKYCNVGMMFYDVTGHIKRIKTLSLASSVSDSEATPAMADYLYFDEEFDATPAYANTNYGIAFCEGGNMVFPATNSSVDYIVKDLVVPAGGYIEFRVQNDTIAKYDIFDGTRRVSVSQQSDYGTISGGNGFFTGNNNSSWRTWRYVKNQDGTYNIYSKCDGDTGWLSSAVNVDENNANKAQVKFNFLTPNAGGVGKSKLAYLKVYGPAPTSALTVTDGYTATPVASGATLAYPASLRAIATPETGKLLVVSYKGNDMAKAQIIKVEDMVNDNIIVNATAEGATKVKVFLWDNFNGLNKLAPAMTFGL